MVARSRILLVLIMGLFVLPLAVAWLGFKGLLNINTGAGVNNGVLVQPTVRISWPKELEQSLKGRWVLAYPLFSECHLSCTEVLNRIRGLHRTLGRQQIQLQIFLIEPADPIRTNGTSRLSRQEILTIYPKFTLAREKFPIITKQLNEAKYTALGEAGLSESGFYLIDPQGSVMMYYLEDADLINIKADLQRLLD